MSEKHIDEDWSDLLAYEEINCTECKPFVTITKDGKIIFSEDFMKMASDHHDNERYMYTPRIGRENGIRELREPPLGRPIVVSLYYSKVMNAIVFDLLYERHRSYPRSAIWLRSHSRYPAKEVLGDDSLYVWKNSFFRVNDLDPKEVQGRYNPKLRRISESDHKWVIDLRKNNNQGE